MKNKPFKDKVIVVTGAASGIGAAVCRKFACEGARIGMLDMDLKGLQKFEKELKINGVDTISFKCDVTREKNCESVIKKIMKHFGGIDVLVNNAGITQRGAFIETQVSVYKKVMDVNFFGALYCTKAAIKSIISRKGQIIVIESIAGVAPLLGRTGYSASKHALHGLFTSLRTEIKDAGAHVMIVCPGFIKTNLQTRALGPDCKVTKRPQSTLGKQDTPENVADIIYKGAIKRKHLLVLTLIGKIGYWVSRFAPIFYENQMAKKLQSELR
ncbi:MAG: SDR family oxidoreductase [Desulfobacterales bacterium]|nr:SDR family oxidoreductase [Desulfobacterales bacterium]